ncbi:MAG: GGDEF domain-containing protein [Alphaproteobacteria bacterium]|nr:GGDEF domain-containing protein [Alphaproteobacteria bacterium]
MKIGETKPLGEVTSIRPRSNAATATGKPALENRPPTDAAEIMGIPAHELAPKVQAAFQTLMEEVARLREELERSHKRIGYLERLADQDTLVPVVNRRAFVRELSRMMSFSERYETPSSILYFDVNMMKMINDTYGHAAGDAALDKVANVLLENIRDSDVVGRLGGDEFGVILAQSDEGRADEKSEQLASAITAEPLDWQGEKIPLSVSYGSYTFAGSEGVDHALHAADRAMYQQKKSSDGRS